MTPEKVKEVIADYRVLLAHIPGESWHDTGFSSRSPSPREAHAHAKWMLDEIDDFVNQGKMEKAFRWLGFLQGVFWCLGTYALHQVREHNRM